MARVTLESGQQVWVITGHEHVCQVLRNAWISSEHSHPAFPSIFPVARQRQEGGDQPKLTYSGMDRPEHTLHRRMVANEFTVGRIATLRARIQQIVDEHVQMMLDGPRPVDLVRVLAEPVPSRVISELLGVPPGDRPALQEYSRILLSCGSSLEQVRSSSITLRALISDILTNKEMVPGGDLLSRLIGRYRKSDSYNHKQMVELAGGLVTAGHETTANMISLGTVALLQHPVQLSELKSNSALIGPAVEELLRYLSIADLVTARVAVANIEIGGVTIRAGEGFIALGAAANHDPAVFEHPETLDFHRDARHHVAFGHGIHRCLGQHLARLELDIVFTMLFTRIPGLRLACAVEALLPKKGAVFQGFEEVPVTW